MKFRKRIDTARARLSLGYALLLGMLLLLAGVVVYESHRISSVNLERQIRATTFLEFVDDLRLDLLNMETGERGYLLNGQREFLQPYRTGRKNFEQDMAKARKINSKGSEPLVNPRLLRNLEQQYETVNTLFEKQIAARRDGAADPAELTEGKADMDLARQTLSKLHKQAYESRKDARQATSNAVFGETLLAAGLGFLALLAGIASFIYLRRSMVRPLQSLRDDTLSASRLLENRSASEDLENATVKPNGWEWQDPASVDGAAEFREVRQAFGALVGQLGLQTQRVRSLVASIEDPLVTVDTEGCIAYFNAAAARSTGFDPEEVKGRPLAEFISDGSGSPPSVKEAMSARKPVSRPEEILHRRDGGEIYVATTASPLLDEGGSVVGGLKVMRDITERKKLEQDLQKINEELEKRVKERTAELADMKFALDESAIVAFTDQHGRITYVNEKFCEISRHSREELMDEDYRIINSGYHSKEFIRNLWHTIAQGKVWRGELRNRAKDGSIYWADTVIVPFLDERGKPYQYAAICQDITERKRIEEEIRTLNQNLEQRVRERSAEILEANAHLQRQIEEREAAEEKYRSIFNNSIEGIYQTTPGGKLLTANPTMAKILGYDSPEEMMERVTDMGSQVWTDPDHRRKFVSELLEAGTISGFETRARRKDGTVIWMSFNARAVRDESGGLKYLEGSLIDITERKRAEEKLRASSEELQRSNRELQDFASIASHDLQEPLRKVRAFGDRLLANHSEELSPRAQDYLQRMQNAAERMQNLINDLLTYSRVTTRAQPFVEVDLSRITREVLSDLETLVERSGGKVEVGDLPTIEGDPTQMRQLMQNLISNALKFHKDGEPPLVNVRGRIIEDGTCEVSVEDQGIGFEEKHADRIFEVFERLHSRQEYEGTGMGLAVCKKIVERHGGSMTVRSKPGQGTTFVFMLPAKHRGEANK